MSIWADQFEVARRRLKLIWRSITERDFDTQEELRRHGEWEDEFLAKRGGKR